VEFIDFQVCHANIWLKTVKALNLSFVSWSRTFGEPKPALWLAELGYSYQIIFFQLLDPQQILFDFIKSFFAQPFSG
jgi:hypothetical protein